MRMPSLTTPLDEPVDMLGIRPGSAGCEGVEDPGRSIGQVEPAVAELVDVSGEEPVRAVGSGACRDPLGDGGAEGGPVRALPIEEAGRGGRGALRRLLEAPLATVAGHTEAELQLSDEGLGHREAFAEH